ncbi:ubiquitin-protein ligase E3A [Pyrenochaeta sp. MPI-SDFR-AT-0127]|nr:ubiquitin-protein ligase E3A [Pyrenochaeta sp. MPI-SDFR-AT-0127]
MSQPDRGLQEPGTRAPRRYSRNVVDVLDASRLVESSQAERQLQFQRLHADSTVSYLSQILHGCKSAYCHTPTCLSCNTSNPRRPFRPPTQLTARILAHYLASQDNPHRGLCRHELKVPPNAVELPATLLDCGSLVYPKLALQDPRAVNTRRTTHASSSPCISRSSGNPQASRDALHQRQQTKKDIKSLGQNLYDSIAVIYSYSKHIPSPASVLALLRSPDTVPEHDIEARSKKPVMPHVNAITPVAHQPSQQMFRTDSHARSMQTTAEVLSNGRQIHKIPYHFPTTQAQTAPQRAIVQATTDSQSDPQILSISKTGKKNFTIGGGKVTAMRHNKPSVPAPKRRTPVKESAAWTAPVIPVAPILNCDILDELKQDVYQHHNNCNLGFNFVVDYDANRRVRPTKPFVNRSLFYTLSDPHTLLQSFRDSNEAFKNSPLPHLDSVRLVDAFRDWNCRNGALVFDSLWIAAGALFTPPPELSLQKSPRLRSRKSVTADNLAEHSSHRQKHVTVTPCYLNNHEAAHLVMICIHALTSSVSNGWPHTWAQLRELRSWGVIAPNAAPNTDAFAHPCLNIIDELEYEPAIRLADRLLCGIGSRTCFEHILASLNRKDKGQDENSHPSTDATLVDVIVQHLRVVEHVALNGKLRMRTSHSPSDDPGWTVSATFMEWLRTIIIKNWDSKAEINKWSNVGTAVILLDKLHTDCQALNLRPSMFKMPLFNERLDIVEEPLNFIDWSNKPNTFHIFQYPSLFPAQHLVVYFRTINFTSMMAQYDYTARTHQMQRSLDMFLREPYWWIIKYRMKVTLSDYLVLDVSREDPLKDTLDQLWGQEKRLLLKPLKVKMGQQEGEVGLDHGGVTYEFFRVVLSEAFKPLICTGMFTIDPQTRMTWFQPRTLEPDWKFEMLGILFSLAIYNGVTLPVTFPIALYYSLLPPDTPSGNRQIKPDTLDYIRDGWPGLAKAFDDLLAWSDGDVGDIMMREYSFSYEAFGQRIDHNMKCSFDHRPSADPILVPSALDLEETPLVTNENREQFVKDYIHHLTYLSISPQLRAFLRGFQTCINPRSLHLFTPFTLRNLVEGTQHINIASLRHFARYEEGYSNTHHTIMDFWAIVESFTQENCRHLLEFVTASDRVPVTGYESITFNVVRIGGEPDSLPSSSTCFGKLYLPQYPDRDTMRRKLELAIQNSQGFGVV